MRSRAQGWDHSWAAAVGAPTAIAARAKTANIIIAAKRFMEHLDRIATTMIVAARRSRQEFSGLSNWGAASAQMPESYGVVSVEWTLMVAGSISKWMSHS